MKRRSNSNEVVLETISEFANLSDRDPKVLTITSKRGVVEFSGNFLRSDSIPVELLQRKSDDRFILPWQYYNELQPDHGASVAYEALLDKKFGKILCKEMDSMLPELAEVLDSAIMKQLEKHLDLLGDSDDRLGHRKIFVTALWAHTFTEKFSQVWLAAMAQHAYFIEHNDFAFGYLSALLDQKVKNESDYLRGKITAKSAGIGGEAKSKIFRPKREAVLAKMQHLVEKGFSRSNAARQAFQAGLGTSQAANVKLWNRHRRK